MLINEDQRAPQRLWGVAAVGHGVPHSHDLQPGSPAPACDLLPYRAVSNHPPQESLSQLPWLSQLPGAFDDLAVGNIRLP